MLKNVKKISYFSILILTIFMFPLGTDAAREELYAIPSGEAVGVKIYTDGLLVVGVAENSPARKSGIKLNDRIISADGEKLTSCERLSSMINECEDTITLTAARGNETTEITVTPETCEDGSKKAGLWLRDSTAGIGTLTYYLPENNSFAALGHGITDIDTGNILTVKSGNILPCEILSVTKSENGNPGEINGSFTGTPFGDIIQNTDRGIYGVCSNEISGEPIPIASPSEIETGYAYILADIDGAGAKEYSIEIRKISPSAAAHKNMTVEITDANLLAVTGGIVQGMSGAPIIQNGKLIGAITHVFVNSPTRGYASFAEDMAELSLKIN